MSSFLAVTDADSKQTVRDIRRGGFSILANAVHRNVKGIESIKYPMILRADFLDSHFETIVGSKICWNYANKYDCHYLTKFECLSFLNATATDRLIGIRFYDINGTAISMPQRVIEDMHYMDGEWPFITKRWTPEHFALVLEHRYTSYCLNMLSRKLKNAISKRQRIMNMRNSLDDKQQELNAVKHIKIKDIPQFSKALYFGEVFVSVPKASSGNKAKVELAVHVQEYDMSNKVVCGDSGTLMEAYMFILFFKNIFRCLSVPY